MNRAERERLNIIWCFGGGGGGGSKPQGGAPGGGGGGKMAYKFFKGYTWGRGFIENVIWGRGLKLLKNTSYDIWSFPNMKRKFFAIFIALS